MKISLQELRAFENFIQQLEEEEKKIGVSWVSGSSNIYRKANACYANHPPINGYGV